MVRMAEIEIKKCGVKFDPPAIVVIYGDKGASKTRRRTMPLHDFDKKSNIDKAVENLHSNPKHGKYVSQISKAQLTRLVTIIRDKLNGMSLEASLARNDDLDKIDPEQNLNAVDEETLQRKKVVMDQIFVKHQLKPGDPGFEYDVQVEFDEEQVIESGWDSGDGSDFEF